MKHKEVSSQARFGMLIGLIGLFILGTAIDVVMKNTLDLYLGGLGSLFVCIVAVVSAYKYTRTPFTWKSLVTMLRLARPRVTSVWDWVFILGSIAALVGVLMYSWQGEFVADMSKMTVGLLLYAVSAALIPPFLEEMVDRGFIQSALEKLGFAMVSTVLFSSAVFSLSHYPANPESIPITFLFGICAGVITIRTKSVWIPFILHGAWNFVAAVLSGVS